MISGSRFYNQTLDPDPDLRVRRRSGGSAVSLDENTGDKRRWIAAHVPRRSALMIGSRSAEAARTGPAVSWVVSKWTAGLWQEPGRGTDPIITLCVTDPVLQTTGGGGVKRERERVLLLL